MASSSMAMMKAHRETISAYRSSWKPAKTTGLLSIPVLVWSVNLIWTSLGTCTMLKVPDRPREGICNSHNATINQCDRVIGVSGSCHIIALFTHTVPLWKLLGEFFEWTRNSGLGLCKYHVWTFHCSFWMWAASRIPLWMSTYCGDWPKPAQGHQANKPCWCTCISSMDTLCPQGNDMTVKYGPIYENVYLMHWAATLSWNEDRFLMMLSFSNHTRITNECTVEFQDAF